MPLFFFHLTFGDRVVLDDEGVELRDRAAACDEARAVIRDLSDRDTQGSGRRWASWFLQVGDERGEFLRLPIGYPALEIVSAETNRTPSQAFASTQAPPTSMAPHVVADLTQLISAAGKRTAQLLERNRQLRSELTSELLLSERTRLHTLEVPSTSRLASCQSADVARCHSAAGPTSPPQLIVLSKQR